MRRNRPLSHCRRTAIKSDARRARRSLAQRSLVAAALFVVLLGGFTVLNPAHAAPARRAPIVPKARLTLRDSSGPLRSTVLAGGCFWGMEWVFEHVEGVMRVIAGYADTSRAHANYRDSSTGRFGDAEAVLIVYDPSRIRFVELLRIYFSVAHDPTAINRQGPDIGQQYRSEIFAANGRQGAVARAYIHQIDRAEVFAAPLATRVSVGKRFFPAEAYHQDYARRHANSRYVRINDRPKIAALKQDFARHYRPTATPVARSSKQPYPLQAGR